MISASSALLSASLGHIENGSGHMARIEIAFANRSNGRWSPECLKHNRSVVETPHSSIKQQFGKLGGPAVCQKMSCRTTDCPVQASHCGLTLGTIAMAVLHSTALLGQLILWSRWLPTQASARGRCVIWQSTLLLGRSQSNHLSVAVVFQLACLRLYLLSSENTSPGANAPTDLAVE